MMLFGNNRKVFESKAIEHIDSLYFVALKLTKNESRASDLVQETYLRAFEHYKQYKEDVNLKAWLLRILTNTFINDYRKSKRESFVFDYDNNESTYYNWIEENVKIKSVLPENRLFFNQLSNEIQEALDSLPEDFKIMILYADVYELSYKEIADILDAPIGTIMSKLFRARKMMQTKLYQQAQQLGLIEQEKPINTKIVKFAR